MLSQIICFLLGHYWRLVVVSGTGQRFVMCDRCHRTQDVHERPLRAAAIGEGE